MSDITGKFTQKQKEADGRAGHRQWGRQGLVNLKPKLSKDYSECSPAWDDLLTLVILRGVLWAHHWSHHTQTNQDGLSLLKRKLL